MNKSRIMVDREIVLELDGLTNHQAIEYISEVSSKYGDGVIKQNVNGIAGEYGDRVYGGKISFIYSELENDHEYKVRLRREESQEKSAQARKEKEEAQDKKLLKRLLKKYGTPS